jgi:type IV secretory pathway TrbL component
MVASWLRVVSRSRTMQAPASGLVNVTPPVLVTRPVIVTGWFGAGAAGVKESMAISTTASSAAGAATAADCPETADAAASSRPVAAAAESLSRRLNTPSP